MKKNTILILVFGLAIFVAGAVFGLLTGFFGLLYLFVWINFTDLKAQEWWTSSFEYQVSQAIPDLIKIVFKAMLSSIT